VGAIKKGKSRDTGNIDRGWGPIKKGKSKDTGNIDRGWGQSRKVNPQTLATLGHKAQDEDEQNTKTQHYTVNY
jgi:hypothetical protein